MKTQIKIFDSYTDGGHYEKKCNAFLNTLRVDDVKDIKISTAKDDFTRITIMVIYTTPII